MVKITILLILIILLFLGSPLFNFQKNIVAAQSKEKDIEGKVKVVALAFGLFDEQNKRINDNEYMVSFRVYIRGNNFLEEMMYRKNGEFELSVPEGIYNIELKSNTGSPINYYRGNFYVHSNQVTKINITLNEGQEVCDEKYGFVMIPDDAHPKKKYNSPNYKELLIDSPYKMVVKYCQKQNKESTEVYKFALLTYKNITISADKIIFNRKKNFVDAIGSEVSPVLVEVENCVKEIDKIKVDLTNSNLSHLVCKAS